MCRYFWRSTACLKPSRAAPTARKPPEAGGPEGGGLNRRTAPRAVGGRCRRPRPAPDGVPARRRPSQSTTTMRSAFWIVASRCAMTSVVRPFGQVPPATAGSPLRLGVERGGRLVQDQDRRVLQEHPRDRQPLLLPARQLDAALADHRVQPVRQASDQSVQPRPAGRLP